MKRPTVVVVLVLALVLVFALASQAGQAPGATPKAKPAKAGLLDGTRWKIELVPPGKGAKPQPDTLIFARGRFDSIACHTYGFGKAPYQAKKEKGAVGFTATTANAKKEKMDWSGKVEGDRISGSFVWHGKKGETSRYTFTGAKQKA